MMNRRNFLKAAAIAPIVAISGISVGKVKSVLHPTQEEVWKSLNSRMRPLPTKTSVYASSPYPTDWFCGQFMQGNTQIERNYLQWRANVNHNDSV